MGYYRYDAGYTPEFEGIERFEGPIVHPQLWDDDIDYTDKRVIVIGSGATAVTLVPAMADTAAHITMLQRSPSYILSVPLDDPIDRVLKRLLGEKHSFPLIRRKHLLVTKMLYQFAQRFPERENRNYVGGGVRRGPG